MKHLLVLIALAASAQQIKINPITGLPDLVGGSGATAGTGITVVGSTISVDTAVIQSRSTAQAGTSTYLRSTTGNDTYVGSLTPTLTAYTTGMCLVLNPDTANTGAATLNVDALGAKSILGPFGSALADGDIPAAPVQVCYNGTAFIKQGFSYLVQDPTAVTGSTKMIIKAGAGQSGNVQEWQSAAGSANASISAAGFMQVSNVNLVGWWTASETASGGISFGSGHGIAWGSSSTNSSSGAISGDTGLARSAAGLTESNSGTLGTLRDHKVRMLVTSHGTDIASAGTIAPTSAVVRVSGTTAIATITVPTNCAVASTACQITLIPTGLWATTTAGNIALASTAVVNKALIVTWHNTAAKWYPSY